MSTNMEKMRNETGKVMTVQGLREMLRPRPEDGHKGTFGHAFIIAGKYGMAGASVLAAKACLRSGVGKVTVHIPQKNNDIVQISVPEAIVQHDSHERLFSQAVDVYPYEAVAIGPGIGTDSMTAMALEVQLLNLQDRPLVLDADALNIIASNPSLLGFISSPFILTPHPAEYRRMAGDEAPQLFAERTGAILVLKGHPTHVYLPEGEVYVCPFGNSGMGTAGSGDVLTGVIVGLLAQGYEPKEAAILGVALHALAGDFAAKTLGEHSLIASDIIDWLHKGIEIIHNS